jgi:hypothetical protein
MSAVLRKNYLNNFKNRLLSIYRQSAEGIEPAQRECHELEGYMSAALDCGLISLLKPQQG